MSIRKGDARVTLSEVQLRQTLCLIGKELDALGLAGSAHGVHSMRMLEAVFMRSLLRMQKKRQQWTKQ